ncbi:MAG: NAD(P)H-hydrate dehydratase [Candidatus Omnitrophica bacterium]|nr:NAD(P)H-hydrate dehydratase [Candidatus Omnitrophota bacterium]
MRLPTRLLRRRPVAFKGDFGHVFILAGSPRYSGAAVLCAEAAIRSGAGLVTLGIPKGINNAVMKIKPKEVMTLPLPETKEGALSSSSLKKIKDFAKRADVIVIGPGLGLDKSTQVLVRKVVRAVRKPIVIDADGLNALAGNLGILPTSVIMTPHPGEMARLTGKSIKYIQANRSAAAKKFAGEHKSVLVLKGHKTVVCGGKNKAYINNTGNPGMATAGSGDVLSGMIAGFLGQGLSAFDAAKYGVYLHGLAGDLAAKEKTQLCLVASDIIDKIPQAVKASR